jgi:hypothetical protein
MPTVGWILEGSVERFWEARTRPAKAAPRVFVCRSCGRPFVGQRELIQHLAAAHPLPVPTLFVNGQPLLRESVLRSPFFAHDVDILHCSEAAVRIDGEPRQMLGPQELAERLAAAADAVIDIALFNDRIEDGTRTRSEYNIRIRQAEPASLNRIDDCFLRILAVDEITHAAIAQFEAALPPSSPEREYGAALGDYAIGILLKEGRAVRQAPIDFAEYAAKMKGALEVLRQFDRPVALAVCSTIRFNLNDFQEYGVVGAGEVVVAQALFRSLAGIGGTGQARLRRATSRSHVPVCPVDYVTHLLLCTAGALAKGSSLQQGAEKALLEALARTSIQSDYDLAKSYVIRAEALIRQGRAADAAPLLRKLRFDPTMHGYARKRITSEEE